MCLSLLSIRFKFVVNTFSYGTFCAHTNTRKTFFDRLNITYLRLLEYSTSDVSVSLPGDMRNLTVLFSRGHCYSQKSQIQTNEICSRYIYLWVMPSSSEYRIMNKAIVFLDEKMYTPLQSALKVTKSKCYCFVCVGI